MKENMDTQKLLELKFKLRMYGIFQKDIAEKCGCTIGNVSHVLNGRRPDGFGILKTSGQLLSARIKEVRRVERILEAA